MTAATTAPVRWNDDISAFEITGHAEASHILRGTGWSSDPRRNPLISHDFAALSPATVLFMDPPDHTRLRRLISPAFTPRAIEALRPRVRAIVAAALDGLDAEPDLLAEFAYLVPLAVIAELLDVGADGAELLQAETPALARLLEIDVSAAEVAAAAEAGLEVTLFLTPLIAQRRQHPGDDFISALLREPEITLDEVLATTMLLLAAGHETTANVIANGALALLQSPDQVPQLIADPIRGIEEILRLCGPVKLVGRTAIGAHEVGGQLIDDGQAALIRIPDTNRDPRVYQRPGAFELARKPAPNLAFGAGAHYCLGAALARLEAAEALSALFTRYRHMRLLSEPRWRESTTFAALLELPVELA
ncbi:cytochrome P450 [Skermania sp. ID1734]|uniref:cytochrome P450 n=1 Tax=Skermania sp. ID1734 TaxID=2597516 RepID=UPI00163DE5AA|nr:cytochrome P450 [Skermania sp. ID1734]